MPSSSASVRKSSRQYHESAPSLHRSSTSSTNPVGVSSRRERTTVLRPGWPAARRASRPSIPCDRVRDPPEPPLAGVSPTDPRDRARAARGRDLPHDHRRGGRRSCRCVPGDALPALRLEARPDRRDLRHDRRERAPAGDPGGRGRRDAHRARSSVLGLGGAAPGSALRRYRGRPGRTEVPSASAATATRSSGVCSATRKPRPSRRWPA